VQSSRPLGRLPVDRADQANRSPIPDETKSDSQDDDGDKIKALGFPAGPIEYTTPLGIKKKTRAFKHADVKRIDEFPSEHY
jgi:hypothetical protein